jgi:hypothetical protein
MGDRGKRVTRRAERPTTADDEWLAGHATAFDPLAWTGTDATEYRRTAFSELASYVSVGGCLPPTMAGLLAAKLLAHLALGVGGVHYRQKVARRRGVLGQY